MSRRNPLEFDISVSGAKKKKTTRARGMTGAVESSTRECEWEGCNKPGIYRAPKSRDQLNDFRWFCLEHVREYNSRWNFFENMSEDEISENLQSDKLWGRQTWKLGQRSADELKREAGMAEHADGEAWKRFGMSDPMDALGDNATMNPGATAEQRRVREKLLPKSLRRALDIMDLDSLSTKKDIRLRYKELVKRYHPDQNGGDRSEEARLREVLWAWDQLKGSDAFPE